MSRPRCSKCGRTLKNPASIARGMGPVCAGAGGSASRRHPPRSRPRSGQKYAAVAAGSSQLQLFAPGEESDETPEMSKRARLAATRARRRRKFEGRQAFQCGLSGRTREPLVFRPTPDGGWTSSSGYTTGHEALERYLRRYGWI